MAEDPGATSATCSISRRYLAIRALLAAHIITRASAIARVGKTLDEFAPFAPVFVARQLTPLQFLIVSSPIERKVVYTQLRNFKSITGRSYALIDSGLTDPRGIALDRDRGALYVADPGARKIFRYRIIVTDASNPAKVELATDGTQITILQNVSAEWVTVDVNGDVFYSDQGSRVIGKIPRGTITRLAEGSFLAAGVSFVSQKELEAASAAQARDELGRLTESIPTDPPADAHTVHIVYEGSVNPHVSVPGGVASDGMHLYWTNMANGTEAGVIVRGAAQPELPVAEEQGSGPAHFASTPLANVTEQSYGIVKSANIVLVSTSKNGVGRVYGVLERTGEVQAFASNLGEPRGLVWDGDQTVFVADEAQAAVWSFPVGRLMEDVPVEKSVVLNGAFGVAIFTSRDAGWLKAGASGLRVTRWACGLAALLAVWSGAPHA